MLIHGWLFLGLVAVLTTGTILYTDDNAVAMVGGVLGFVLWSMWALGSLNLEVPIEGSPDLTMSAPFLGLAGAMLALIPGIIALTGPVELTDRWRQTQPDDI